MAERFFSSPSSLMAPPRLKWVDHRYSAATERMRNSIKDATTTPA